MLLERIDLGERGREFVREWLEAGQTLGQLLRQFSPIDTGRVYSYVPAPCERFGRHDLAHGGLFPSTRSAESMVEPVEDLDAALARLTVMHLELQPTNCAIFENLLAGASDKYLQKLTSRPFTVGDEVYFTLGPGPVVADQVRLAIDEARTASGYIGCLSELADDEQFLVAPARLRAMAKRATAIVCAAFDGEGFVIWSASDAWMPERLEL